MYLPEHFEDRDAAAIAALIAEFPLACVVAQTPQGLLANHIPLLVGRAAGRSGDPGGGSGGSLIGSEMIGHVALANDMHRVLTDGQEVLAVFRGEEAYVSPNWYPSKAQHHRHVPTWNYRVVHVHGTIRFDRTEAAARAAAGLLTRAMERRVNGPAAWRMAEAPADWMAGMVRSIVALRIRIARIEAKAKLGQNRTDTDRSGAADGLRAAGQSAMAARMDAAGPGDPPPPAPKQR